MKITQIISPVLIIFLAVIMRLLPHPPNFAPIAAMALFGGAYLNKRYALVIPLIAMIISDYFIGFHNVILFVYGSFFISGLLGLWLRNHKTLANTFMITFASSLLFFIITNFGVWFVGNMYPKTVSGLVTCYTMAIPFFRNTILGDFFYVGLFFGGYEIVRKVLGTVLINTIPASREIPHKKDA